MYSRGHLSAVQVKFKDTVELSVLSFASVQAKAVGMDHRHIEGGNCSTRRSVSRDISMKNNTGERDE